MTANPAPSSPSQNPRVRRVFRWLGGPSVLLYAMPWLMVLLVWGTVAQKDLGLYEAHRLYFSSWIVWAGFVPLPGAYMTLGAITLCLTLKFLFFSPWRMSRAGTILAHLGVLVLMIGGLLTAMTQQEGYLMLREGERGNAVSDYHQRLLRVEKDGAAFHEIRFEDLRQGSDKTLLPFTFDIQTLCRNCRPTPVDAPSGHHGLAEKVTLVPAPLDQSDEANLSGLIFRLSGLKDGQDGTYLVVEEIPHTPEITHEGSTYRFSIGRARTDLPFDIELQDFTRDLHPGTDMARAFRSDVIVHDSGVHWPAVISMNEPLRYKGYTFYQSSFSLRPDGEYSILSVVRNKGRVLPYAASAIIFAGLLLQVLIRVKTNGAKA